MAKITKSARKIASTLKTSILNLVLRLQNKIGAKFTFAVGKKRAIVFVELLTSRVLA